MFMWEEVGHSLQRSLRQLGAQSFALPLAQHAADTMNEEHVPHVPREAAEPLLYKVRGVPEMGLCEGGDNHKITI
jgi:hypothetical protein